MCWSEACCDFGQDIPSSDLIACQALLLSQAISLQHACHDATVRVITHVKWLAHLVVAQERADALSSSKAQESYLACRAFHGGLYRRPCCLPLMVAWAGAVMPVPLAIYMEAVFGALFGVLVTLCQISAGTCNLGPDDDRTCRMAVLQFLAAEYPCMTLGPGPCPFTFVKFLPICPED